MIDFWRSCLKVHTSDHEWPRMTTSDHEWPRMTTSDHEWPRMTTSDHEWPRVTTSDYEWPRVRLHQNIWLISWWRHHYIILWNNHYFTANWPFPWDLYTWIRHFRHSWLNGGGARGRTGRGHGGVQTSRHPHPLISVPATFLNFFFPPFFPPPVHLPPSFLPGVPNSVHLHPYPPPSKATSDQGWKKRKIVKMTNIKINGKVFCESTWFKEIFNC